jgi:hypothetical protein
MIHHFACYFCQSNPIQSKPNHNKEQTLRHRIYSDKKPNYPNAFLTDHPLAYATYVKELLQNALHGMPDQTTHLRTHTIHMQTRNKHAVFTQRERGKRDKEIENSTTPVLADGNGPNYQATPQDGQLAILISENQAFSDAPNHSPSLVI